MRLIVRIFLAGFYLLIVINSFTRESSLFHYDQDNKYYNGHGEVSSDESVIECVQSSFVQPAKTPTAQFKIVRLPVSNLSKKNPLNDICFEGFPYYSLTIPLSLTKVPLFIKKKTLLI